MLSIFAVKGRVNQVYDKWSTRLIMSWFSWGYAVVNKVDIVNFVYTILNRGSRVAGGSSRALCWAWFLLPGRTWPRPALRPECSWAPLESLNCFLSVDPESTHIPPSSIRLPFCYQKQYVKWNPNKCWLLKCRICKATCIVPLFEIKKCIKMYRVSLYINLFAIWSDCVVCGKVLCPKISWRAPWHNEGLSLYRNVHKMTKTVTRWKT